MQCTVLAALSGVSRYTLKRYECNKTQPSLIDLKKIAAVLAIEADKLFDDYYRFLDYPCSEKVKEIRIQNGLMQRELGAVLGVSTCTIKRWEYGKNAVPRDMWEKLKSMELGIEEYRVDRVV